MAKILLIEPAEDMGKLLKSVLSECGHKVNWHKDAQAAVHAADKLKPDAVVLELAIPGHNGVEFLHEFRSYTEWMDIPVIVHSQIAPDRSRSGRRLMSSLGIYQHLYKPTTRLKELVSTTEEALA
jgi:DNA-binding response OmpR family regulator